jgi:hypothetical protein
MKYACHMGSGAMIYTPNFIQVGSGIPKLIRKIHRHADRKEITKQSKKRNKWRWDRKVKRRRREDK